MNTNLLTERLIVDLASASDDHLIALTDFEPETLKMRVDSFIINAATHQVIDIDNLHNMNFRKKVAAMIQQQACMELGMRYVQLKKTKAA